MAVGIYCVSLWSPHKEKTSSTIASDDGAAICQLLREEALSAHCLGICAIAVCTLTLTVSRSLKPPS